MELSDHARRNKAAWEAAAAGYVGPAERNWARAEFSWGMFDIPESEIGVLPDVAGMDVVELGCGTAYVSAWLARARRAADRRRRDRGPARDGAADAGRARARVPADPGQRGGGAAARAQRRHGDQRVRGVALVRARARGSPRRRGCCAPAADLVFMTNSLLATLTAPRRGTVQRPPRPAAAGAARGHAIPTRSRSSSTSPTASGSRCCAGTGFTVTGLHDVYAPAGRRAHALRLDAGRRGRSVAGGGDLDGRPQGAGVSSGSAAAALGSAVTGGTSAATSTLRCTLESART